MHPSPEHASDALVVEARDRWILLVLATLIFAMSVADRFLMSLFIEPIKAEYGLSDTAVGLVTGSIFGLIYAVASIPIGVLADRANRRNMLAVCVIVFGAMTSLSGATVTLTALLLSRVGVAIGEAGCTPVPIALIADKFSVRRRAMAMAFFSVGASVGGWIAAAGGGALEAAFGWRTAMIVFGLGTIPLGLAVFLFTREPRRGALDAGVRAAVVQHGLADTFRFIRSQRSVLHTIIGGTILSFWGWGFIWWTPALLERGFGMTVAEVGSTLGPIHGIAGTVAILLTTVLMGKLADRDPREQLWFLGGLTVVGTVPSIVAVLNTSRQLELLLFWPFFSVVYLYAGPSFAIISSGVPASMRGQVTAIYVAAVNFVLLVLAPQFVGGLSDLLVARTHDPATALRYALLPLAFTGFWGAFHFLRAARYVRADLDLISGRLVGDA